MGIHSWFIKGVAVLATVAVGACLAPAAGAQGRPGITTPETAAGKNPMTILGLQTEIVPGEDKQVVPLFTGPRRTLVQITLRNGATLAAHKAPVPITIHWVAGSGTLTLPGQGPAVPLKPGVLVTIEPGVVHEIVASPSVSILLTQFTER
jgi:quercetin dioxygenase-like cupin family protein